MVAEPPTEPTDPAIGTVVGVAAEVVAEARARGVRIAVAESLTGGLLASAIVSIPGASQVFSGGVVAYDTALKRTLLGVDAQLLQARGPVDGEVAKQMARGVRRLCAVPSGDGSGSIEADWGIATTGVAGPDPDARSGQVAGTVWVGLSSQVGETAMRLKLPGGRAEVRSVTVHEALKQLRDAILHEG